MIGCLLVSFGLSTHSFGLDESFSVYISQNWGLMTHILWTQEANMWLYYFLFHYWLILGHSELITRSFPALFAVLTIPIIYRLTAYLINRRVAFLAGLLTVVNIFFIFYAQQARSYSLSLFLICISDI